MYEIRFMGAAEKYLKKINEKGLKEIFRTTFNKLSKNPYIGDLKKGDLSGIYCIDIYYNKTNYEIAYRIYENEGYLVVVILAGTRENFYEELKRHIN